MSYPYIHTGQSVSILVDGKQHVISESHANFTKITDAIKAKDWDKIPGLVTIAKMIEATIDGSVSVRNGQVFYNDVVVHNSLTTRILRLLAEGFDIDPFVKFMENLMRNPSNTAVNELYDFLELCTLPITDDGHFLAYKKVNTDLKDFYTGKFDHAIGTVLEMERNGVDDNRDNTCSHGFHFCSFSYLPHYASSKEYRVMIVKINPKDVVSIPSDYNNSKGRACRYEIVDEHHGKIEEEGLQRSCYTYASAAEETLYEGDDEEEFLEEWGFSEDEEDEFFAEEEEEEEEAVTYSIPTRTTPQRDSKGRFIKRTV